ncbi:hypothetical protein CNMCM5793_004327 [Aspergillus hiratsukae]|uniref:Uncharacterized protein n=1 Tax=Aspergillus hiratsukae TaxID=1194566 RepID=A0A8H6P2T4_9EURO|nr:hypothetical protein CNMCM5793_004327 [Aspergillus hiratsukae]KAF7159260.1 hypothetical protein CNMCM6106_006395 [Aspergillus hiratsukae]
MQGSNNPSLPRIVIEPSSPQSPSISCAFSPSTPTNPTSSRSTAKPSQQPSQTESRPGTGTGTRSSKIHPSFQPILRLLRTPLCPLVSSTTGQQHPEFPKTLLAYHLLTSRQLDNLARHFHQVWPPVDATTAYPVSIPAWIGAQGEESVDLRTKRRRFGRFIGLRGCESPTFSEHREVQAGSDSDSVSEEDTEELLARMEWEWEQGLLQAQRDDPDAILRWKAFGC